MRSMAAQLSIVSPNRIERSIYLVRGHKVILDRDLAKLYGVETRVLNQAVRRNLNRFPGDFLLQLSREEIRNISQFVISSGLKKSPSVFAFTEQGVAMLSSVLRSPRAVAVNIEIMRAFVRLREMTHVQLANRRADLTAMSDTVNHHRASSANTFATIRVKRDRLLAFGDETFVNDIEHFQKGHVRNDVARFVSDELPGVVLVLLPPNFESEIHETITLVLIFPFVGDFGIA